MPERDLLPFDIRESEVLSHQGKESDIKRLKVKDNSGNEQKRILKETRIAEVSNQDDTEIQKLKANYEFLKNHPKFGKFVIQTDFVKAQSSELEPAKAYLVQQPIEGKRLDDISDKELYSDPELLKELLGFVEASIEILEETKNLPGKIPDLYADKKWFLGDFLHNPRYSGNIVVADKTENQHQRIHFVDSGTIFGAGREKPPKIKKILYPVDVRLQLLQLRRWKKSLEERLGNRPLA